MQFRLTYQDVPARYFLGFRRAQPVSFWLAVEPGAVEYLQTCLASGHPQLPYMSQSLKMADFVSSLTDGWGFGSVAHPYASMQDWPTWSFQIPVNSRSKEEYWQSLRELSATLWVAFMFLNSADQDGDQHRWQTLAVNMSLGEGLFHQAPICTFLSPRSVMAISSGLEDRELDLIEDNAHLAYVLLERHLLSMSSEHRREEAASRDWFHARLEDRTRFFLDVPGDAAGLGTLPDRLDDLGRTLVSHNLDSIIQQLSVLAGVCTLDAVLRRRLGY